MGSNILEGKWQIGVLAYIITFVITFIVVLIVNRIDKNKVTEDIIKSIKNNELN